MNYPLSDAICRLIRCKNEKHFMYIFNELMRYPEQVQDFIADVDEILVRNKKFVTNNDDGVTV